MAEMSRGAWLDIKARYANDLTKEGIIIRFLLSLVEALLRFVHHDFRCKKRPCQCGLQKVLKEVRGE